MDWFYLIFSAVCALVGVAVAGLLNNQNQTRIMAKLSELAGIIAGVNTALEKVQAEVQALKDSLSDVELPAAAQAALDQLVATTKAIDDINPDA